MKILNDAQSAEFAAVVIGRNEGRRLVDCLAALEGRVAQVIYVDSGSSDGSCDTACAFGAHVVELDPSHPFSAARARNAGRNAISEPAPDFIMFIDGDCEIREGWLAEASAFLSAQPNTAVVCGRRRERFPDASIYNRLCDEEWDTPTGEAKACGGDAVIRRIAFDQVGGFRENLIAGEEPELCLRLRREGWKIYRLNVEMTWHDAEITRFTQWWRRSKRAGHAFAEGAKLFGSKPEHHWVEERNRSLVWGLALPLGTISWGLIWPPAILILILYPIQVIRLAWLFGGTRYAWGKALLLIVGKFAEAQGAIIYFTRNIKKGSAEIIEYKSL